MGRRFWILFGLSLFVFAGLGFLLGRSGMFSNLDRAQNWQIRVLTEKSFLFPEEFKKNLEGRLPVHFEIEIAEDPDSFMEMASKADVLWARKDWILQTELQLKDFKSEPAMKSFLSRALSADFFDPEETSATVLPLLWTLPLVRTKGLARNAPKQTLNETDGEIHWPFWGLEEYFPEPPVPRKGPENAKTQWSLFPSSSEVRPGESLSDFWLPPAGKIRPFVVCLAFVENDRLPSKVKRRLVEEWSQPATLAKLAFQTKMALTLVQAEELLPPWQRASALRQIGLTHLARP